MIHDVDSLSTAQQMLHLALEEGNAQYLLGAIGLVFGAVLWGLSQVFTTNKQLDLRLKAVAMSNTAQHRALHKKIDKIIDHLLIRD